ncbi:MAG TPA: hypothetical protein DIU15_13620 [Deltaproteobacteria bacterium]|nr:hypothetical protein [Deltaproteobacteria bacterium]HCP47079.1 hypothetical protein [Deltaproteobacteria bacterium]
MGSSSPSQQFAEANALKEADACDEAIHRYDEVLNASPTLHRTHVLALYNQAVCFESLGSLDRATANYTQLLSRNDAEARAIHADVQFRRGLVRIAENQPRAARRDLLAVRHRTTDRTARARIDVQLGWLDVESRHLARASHRLLGAIRVLTGKVSEPTSEAYFLAQALCALGDVFVAEASRVDMHRRGVKRTVRALNRRAELLSRAQDYYVAAIDQQVPTWAAAAALHLGRAYQAAADELWEFYSNQQPTAKPEPTAQAAMQRWLLDRIPTLLRKSFEAYSICQSLGYETGDISRFTRACSEALDSFPTERLTVTQES